MGNMAPNRKKMRYRMSIILITGGTSGFGKADAKEFAGRGEQVVITGRREDTLR